MSPVCCLETVSRPEGGASPGRTGSGGDLGRWSWETRRQGCHSPVTEPWGAESCAQRALGTSEDQNLPLAKLAKARERSAWRS